MTSGLTHFKSIFHREERGSESINRVAHGSYEQGLDLLTLSHFSPVKSVSLPRPSNRPTVTELTPFHMKLRNHQPVEASSPGCCHRCLIILHSKVYMSPSGHVHEAGWPAGDYGCQETTRPLGRKVARCGHGGVSTRVARSSGFS